ncbi:hypothetical protein GINT2_001229 [Glugoides intestinalis]
MVNISCCCSKKKYVIYITGSLEHKRRFCEAVFNIKLKDISFSENMVTFNGTNLILLVIANEENLEDVHKMHMKMANAVIALSTTNKLPNTEKKTLFVKMNGHSNLEGDNNVIVRSVENESFSEVKKGVKELIKLLKD